MAGITYVGTVWTTSADPWTSSSFSPAVNDLIVVVGSVSGAATYGSQTCVESAGGGTYTRVFATDGVRGYAWIADQLCAATTSRTITVDLTASETGGGFSLYRVSGMTFTGASALKQSKSATFAASGTPSVTMDAAITTSNPVFGMANNSTNSTTTTAPPTSWTERFDNGFTSPATGGEWCDRASGETNTTINWTATSVSSGIAYVLELDASAGAATSLITPTGFPPPLLVQ